jgi:hypothetical protein
MVDIGNVVYGPPITAAPTVQPLGLPYVQQLQQLPLYELLAEARQTNALLRNILETVAVANGLRPSPKPDLDLTERVAWLERQIAELKERR